jgi:hypothetical protein
MKCENCQSSHNGEYGSGRFCDIKCARSFSTKLKRKEINDKVSHSLVGRKLTDEHKKNIEKATNFNRKSKSIRSCLNCGENIHCSPSDKRKYCSLTCWTTFTEKNKEAFELYRQKCSFDFKVEDYPEKFDLSLIQKYGWYSPSNKRNNLNGISKDHKISVREGFEKNIDSSIIKHPANCKLLTHKENQQKYKNSSITIEELMEKINSW